MKTALEAVEVNLMTVTEVLGQGRQKGLTEVYRGAKEAGGLLKKVSLDIAVNENFVEPTITAITKGAHTGEVGDGKIFVLGSGRMHSHQQRRTGRQSHRLERIYDLAGMG